MRNAIIVVVTAIILFGASSLVEATTVEVSVATDKATYLLGEDVTVFVTAYNPNPQPVTLFFGSALQRSYSIDGIYDWRQGHGWGDWPTRVVIGPNDTHTWDLIHGSYERQFYPLDIGTHTVIGEVVGYGYSTPIEFKVAPDIVDAMVDIGPDTLNLASKGEWLTCYIWLPEDYNVADIDPNSVLLEDEIQPEWIWFDEVEEVVMAKFSRSDIQELLTVGEVELTVSGELLDGTRFEGTDIIRVIDKGSKKK